MEQNDKQKNSRPLYHPMFGKVTIDSTFGLWARVRTIETRLLPATSHVVLKSRLSEQDLYPDLSLPMIQEIALWKRQAAEVLGAETERKTN